MDVHTKKQRSFNMSRIKSKNTKPELTLRKLLSSAGIRNYRIAGKVKGRPDIYFPKRRVAVFVDGCFWHKCPRCFVKPKSRTEFWTPKLRENVLRDRKNTQLLRKSGIVVLRFWEHEVLEQSDRCYNKIIRIYEKTRPDKK